ncbi:unnamed protein product [Miscanthus lutarioriparius]|uniref:Plant heme peroxidase family profile domain-containing protein n=1 Tax=Miscanthus lutarioriparius TaxID=422564 RepID=A0A811NIT1_9POAL|nr:unnamed protein product [Miscanthus lutarioriparius]
MAVPRGRLPLVAAVAVFLAFLCCRGEAAARELKVGYYAETCPEAEDIVRETMARARAREARSVASVMRLQFHDCFVNRFASAVCRFRFKSASPLSAGCTPESSVSLPGVSSAELCVDRVPAAFSFRIHRE